MHRKIFKIYFDYKKKINNFTLHTFHLFELFISLSKIQNEIKSSRLKRDLSVYQRPP